MTSRPRRRRGWSGREVAAHLAGAAWRRPGRRGGWPPRKPRASDSSMTASTTGQGIFAVVPRLSSTRIFIQSTPSSALAATCRAASTVDVAVMTGPAKWSRARPERGRPWARRTSGSLGLVAQAVHRGDAYRAYRAGPPPGGPGRRQTPSGAHSPVTWPWALMSPGMTHRARQVHHGGAGGTALPAHGDDASVPDHQHRVGKGGAPVPSHTVAPTKAVVCAPAGRARSDVAARAARVRWVRIRQGTRRAPDLTRGAAGVCSTPRRSHPGPRVVAAEALKRLPGVPTGPYSLRPPGSTHPS